MSTQKTTYDQRQLKLEARMRALLERQKQLRERQRTKEKDQMRVLYLSLGKLCVAEGIESPQVLAELFKSAKTREARPSIQEVAISQKCPTEPAA